MDISAFYMRLNSVYKQAGLERAHTKKMLQEQTQSMHYEKLPIFDKLNMMSW